MYEMILNLIGCLTHTLDHSSETEIIFYDKSWLLLIIFHVPKYQHSVVVVTPGKLCVGLGHSGSENVIKQSEAKHWQKKINFLMCC